MTTKININQVLTGTFNVQKFVKKDTDYRGLLEESGNLKEKVSVIYDIILANLKNDEVKWNSISHYLRDNYLLEGKRIVTGEDGKKSLVDSEWGSKENKKTGVPKLLGIQREAVKGKYLPAIWLNNFNSYRTDKYTDYDVLKIKDKAPTTPKTPVKTDTSVETGNGTEAKEEKVADKQPVVRQENEVKDIVRKAVAIFEKTIAMRDGDEDLEMVISIVTEKYGLDRK